MMPGPSWTFAALTRALRLAAIGTAALLLLLAVLDPTRRVLFLAVGAVLVVLAILADRFLRNYKGIALIALNSFILLAGIEIASAALLSVVHLPISKRIVARLLGEPNDLIEQHYLRIPYYANAAWGRQYWTELSQALEKTYQPYVVWRSPAFVGETLNIDERGRRKTPGSECTDDARKVFVFGGSAVWGWGAPDWGTIPAFLQRRLDEARGGGAVCVTNFGENAFVSTQDLIQLYLELQASNVPDLVIFYDGVNDVLAAHQTGEPIVHQNLSEIADRFSQGRDGLLDRLNSFRLLGQILAQLSPRDADVRRQPIRGDRLPREIVAAHREIQRIVASLAARHDFEYAFFWQPHILAGEKPLAPAEAAMVTGLDWVLNMNDELSHLFETTYRIAAAEAADKERFFDLSGIFDETPSQIWIDTWGHVTPAGNEVIAQAMVGALKLGDGLPPENGSP